MAECFAIFEGGGAKGLAHVGALKEAEGRNLKFIGVAGASAGAIIAALVAAGFRADELFRPGIPAGVVQPLLAAADWLEILDVARWREFELLTAQVKQILPETGSPGLGTAWRAWRFYQKRRRQVEPALGQRGYFSTKGFEGWFNDALCRRLGVDGQVTFEQLDAIPNTIPLKLIAVDIEAQKLVTFSRLDSPKLSVAKAVAASISIPFFFAPTMINGRAMVDGGLMSNFPAWLFELERSLSPPFTRTYGFTLVASTETAPAPDSVFKAAVGYTGQVLQTGVFGGQTLLNEDVEFLQVVPIKTRFGVLDFELDEQKKAELYNEGLQSARDFFRNQSVVDDNAVTVTLMQLSDRLRGKIGRPLPRLRANVMLPVKQNHLRVTYSYNMGNDADDRLLMLRNQTGAGQAFDGRDPIVTDVRMVRTGNIIRGLNKYDTALVPGALISLISIPIFTADNDWTRPRELRAEPIGILSFDCDEDILAFFNDRNIQDFFAQASILVGRLLRG